MQNEEASSTDETRPPKNPEMSIIVHPEQPGAWAPTPHQLAHVSEVLRTLSLKMRTSGGTEIEIPLSEISMGQTVHEIRQPRQQPASGARHAKCGNCGDRLPLTGDAEADHHNAMRHKLVCRVAADPARQQAAMLERSRLIDEHQIQPMQAHYRQLQAAPQLQLTAETQLQLTAPKKPWWKFW
jgi:hypothetical protein